MCSYVSWVQLPRNMPPTITVNLFSNFSNSIFYPNLPIFISSLDPPQGDYNESVQQTALLATTSTDIALTTALTNLDSKKLDKSSILRIDRPLLDTTFDLALTNLTVILSLHIVIA